MQAGLSAVAFAQLRVFKGRVFGVARGVHPMAPAQMRAYEGRMLSLASNGHIGGPHRTLRARNHMCVVTNAHASSILAINTQWSTV